MWDALKKVEERYAELTRLLGTVEVASDPRKLRELSKERASLEETIRVLDQHRKVERTIADDEHAAAQRRCPVRGRHNDQASAQLFGCGVLTAPAGAVE